MIRAAALISLVVAFLLGFIAVGDFRNDDARRVQAVENLRSAHTRNILSLSKEVRDANQAEADIKEAESAERRDGVVGLVAVAFLIAGLVMLSRRNGS